MRYIGSKLRLINFIRETVEKHCGNDLHDKVFCDIFAGTGAVGRSFSPLVKKVIANDLEKYSYIANYVQLKGYDEEVFRNFMHSASLRANECIDDNRNLFDAYAEGGSSNRLFFSKNNGLVIQATRNMLSECSRLLNYKNYLAILYSIMDGADKVANTMSTYGMFASKLKENSLKDVSFELPKKAENAGDQNEVYMSDANELIREIEGDILYLDPPYNTRQYSSYYFVLNAIAENRARETDTKSGVKKDECNKSDYNHKATVAEALEDLISNAKFEWIFMSYNNEGLLTFDEIKEIMSKYGDYSVESTPYQRYKADNNRNQAAEGVLEYIHVLHKGVFTNKENVEDPLKSVELQGVLLKSDTLSRTGTVLPKDTLEEAVEEYNRRIKENAVQLKLSVTPETEKNVAEARVKINKLMFSGKNRAAYEQAMLPNATGKSIIILGKTPKIEVKVEEPKKSFVVSPMNYMGGKKKLLPTLVEHFPKDITVFIDLFCGGATVGINAEAGYVLFNDNIVPLIEMYKYMKNNSVEDCLRYIDSVIEAWGLTQNEEDKDKYYAFRESYNSTPVSERNPLDLFVLMAYSFNNQIRFAVNKNWKFNIPFGANRSSFNDKMRENLIGFINALHKKNCFFVSVDFADVPFDKQTFVYADPPYLISQATYNDGWDEEKERTLLGRLKELNDMGGRFALSNVLENKGEENTILKEWAETNGFNIIHLDKSYANSYYHRKDRESKTDEVLITNYSIDGVN
ncbi:MAG: Dam family site-specific DNA-(adenine-N6)-methyltransferase [Paludibacteraceae bacterium]|nr:Dam family site-specific DNA-(adenine-N6)-methyltransferase [Paludibacteraceae bacterium]